MKYFWSWSVALLLLAAPLAHAQMPGLPAGTRIEKDVAFATLGDAGTRREFKLDIYYPPPAASPTTAPATLPAAIVRFAPERETPSGAAVDLLNHGFVLVYAGYLPASPPMAPSAPAGPARAFSPFPEDVAAAKAAIRFLRAGSDRLHIDKDRLAAWGSGHGATIAALLAVTPDQKNLNGSFTDNLDQTAAVRALCLFEGITDWRNAELYGDESVNFPNSAAYQLFGGNPKEHTEAARQASAVNYITPLCPPTLMVTLASDEQRAMHEIFAETLHRAGVRSALYQEPAGMATTRGLDESRLDRTVLQFFSDVLDPARAAPAAMTAEQQIDQLAAAGLFKQARRLIDEQIAALDATSEQASGQPATPVNASTASRRAAWLRKLRQINDQQQAPALKELLAARKAGAGALPDAAGGIPVPHALWTIREVLTDPERIGQYSVEATVPQRIFDSRADALKFVETLNASVDKGDQRTAGEQAAALRNTARRGDADSAILTEFLTRYDALRGRSSRVWPPGLRGVPYARDFGQDLYGYWMDIQFGGVVQRLRYIPSGSFRMGSAREEWGRLPGEPILNPTDIAKGFWLGDSEVTQGLYEAVMGADENHAAFRVSGKNAEDRARLPIENVSYAHAVNFLNKLGIDARLPSQAEWEYACRAGSASMYSGTGRLADMAWFWDEAQRTGNDKNGGLASPVAPALDQSGQIDVRILHELETDSSDTARFTHPVKQKLPNAWGLYDMHGNVWEWCSGSAPDKPRDYHPAKGGSWISIPQSCRAARDVWLPVEAQSWNVGFRICITAE